MNVGDRFRRLRELRHWKQSEMAEKLGVSPAAVSLYESGKAEPRWSIVARLVDMLGVPFTVFTRDEVNWLEVERIMLENRIRELYDKPSEPDIDLGKDKEHSRKPNPARTVPPLIVQLDLERHIAPLHKHGHSLGVNSGEPTLVAV